MRLERAMKTKNRYLCGSLTKENLSENNVFKIKLLFHLKTKILAFICGWFLAV